MLHPGSRLRQLRIRCCAHRVLLSATLLLVLASWGNLWAQQTVESPRLDPVAQPVSETDRLSDAGPLPDAPVPQNASEQARAPQTKRILGIIPNFRAISTDEKLPAQSVKEKFLTCTEDSFDYSAIFVPAMLAGYGLGTNATPEFGQGAAGYGTYFWHSAVDQTVENYMVEFVVPVAHT